MGTDGEADELLAGSAANLLDEPPRPSTLRRLAASLGPGIISGASDDDPSAITTYSIVGASQGYASAVGTRGGAAAGSLRPVDVRPAGSRDGPGAGRRHAQPLSGLGFGRRLRTVGRGQHVSSRRRPGRHERSAVPGHRRTDASLAADRGHHAVYAIGLAQPPPHRTGSEMAGPGAVRLCRRGTAFLSRLGPRGPRHRLAAAGLEPRLFVAAAGHHRLDPVPVHLLLAGRTDGRGRIAAVASNRGPASVDHSRPAAPPGSMSRWAWPSPA